VRLIGHSQGAMLALWLALARLDSLRLLARRGVGRALLSLPLPPPAYRRILAGTMGPAALRAHPALVRATYRATHRARFGKTVSSYLREMFRGAEREPPRYVLSDAELRHLARPVLVLWGERDTAFQAIAEAKARAALMPRGAFEVVPGGHEPWLDDVEACARLICGFHSSRGRQAG
jgi:pimeloyl-ACP methyl ester carboxylesterase